MNKPNRLQMLLDAKTLGVTMRDIAAMTNYDAEMARKVYAIRNAIFQRYNARDALGCMLKIHIALKASERD